MGISVFLDIVVIIMVVLFIAIFGIAIYIIIKNAKTPIVTERAKVISKRSFRNPSNGVFSYRAIFDVKGNMVELVVKYAVYQALNEGEEGILTYKGSVLVNFDKNL